MRESISESWTIQIVAAFILLFVAFLSLMISYSKCFKTKNQVISIVEKYEGFEDSYKIINEYLNASNYKGSGKCDLDAYGIFTKAYGMPEESNPTDKLVRITAFNKNNKYRYCVYENNADDVRGDYIGTLINYEIVLFYSFNIPAFGDIASFEVSGKTIDLDHRINIPLQ